jgi:hypothetical protein
LNAERLKMNRSSSKADLKLTIKAANQKHEDFLVESFQMNWSVKQLKDHLSENYPNSPNPQSIRLIYSGKLLNDHAILKDCLRQVFFFKLIDMRFFS